jgi:hypothetical protein
MTAHSDQRGIVSGNDRRKPRRKSTESMLVGPMGVDDIRPAPPEGVRYELPLVLVRVAGRSSSTEWTNMNRQLIAMQHHLARDVRINRDEGYVMTARKQASDLMKRRGAAEPIRDCSGRLVEEIGKLAQARLARDGNLHRARRIVAIRI